MTATTTASRAAPRVGRWALAMCLLLAHFIQTAAADTHLPTVDGPVTRGARGYPYSASIVDLAPWGYSEREYFISGKAHTWKRSHNRGFSGDGRWTVVPGETHPYKTRILVRSPESDRFNGTVVVEVMQEYFGSERDTGYRWNAETYLRRGFAWVGVSVFHEGIDDARPQQTTNFGGMSFTSGNTLVRWDPQRYSTLSVPSSELAYDILTQVARLVGPGRGDSGVDPLEGLDVRHVLATGNTMAAHRLAVYINAIQPVEQVYDGFFLQEAPGQGLVTLGGSEPVPPVLRTDPDAPVIVLNTTTAAVQTGPLPEGERTRYWTPAGSSHTTGAYMQRVGEANRRDLGMDGNFCPAEAANSFPVQYISGAAIVALDRWVKEGNAAPRFPQLEVVRDGDRSVTPFDEHGNSLGGLRSPWVDVPVARYDWRSDCPGGSGLTEKFGEQKLRTLYGTPREFLRKFETAVAEAREAGVLLEEDAATALQDARSISW